jgi:ribosome-associated translation inhibitor RaiA
MTITALLVFMVLSQIAMAAYLLYTFNDVEREARKRNADMRAHIDSAIAELERRLNGGAPMRKRVAGEN